MLFACWQKEVKTTKISQPSSNVDTIKLVYKPFKMYKGDTLRYLKENFVDHKAYYLNKPLKALMEKLEIKIYSTIPTSSIFERTDVFDGLMLNFSGIYKTNPRQKRGMLNIKLQKWFYRDTLNVIDKKNLKLGTNIEYFFSDMIVSDIGTNWIFYYFPLKEYKKDTLAYLQENFVGNKMYFKGNNMILFLRNLEVVPKEVKAVDTLIHAKQKLTSGIDMQFVVAKTTRKQNKTLRLYFERPISLDSVYKFAVIPTMKQTFGISNIYKTTKIKEIREVKATTTP